VTPVNKERIRHEIRTFVASFANERGTATTWLEPLVGFVDASDPGFEEVRRQLGPRHALPRDLMPDAASAIALFVPYTNEVGRANRPGELAARSWCVAFDETRQLLIALGEQLRSSLDNRGDRLTAIPESHAFHPGRVAADWSHKHVAVLAGLGRPGYHNMLITARGCFGRVWSYLTDVPLASDPRTVHEPCLRRAGQACASCVERCVGAALLDDRYDRHACYAQCLKNEDRYPELPVTDLCGKCMVAVPCAHVDPWRRNRRISNTRSRSAPRPRARGVS
jgi:epoxyqueuosine reductase QueG